MVHKSKNKYKEYDDKEIIDLDSSPLSGIEAYTICYVKTKTLEEQEQKNTKQNQQKHAQAEQDTQDNQILIALIEQALEPLKQDVTQIKHSISKLTKMVTKLATQPRMPASTDPASQESSKQPRVITPVDFNSEKVTNNSPPKENHTPVKTPNNPEHSTDDTSPKVLDDSISAKSIEDVGEPVTERPKRNTPDKPNTQNQNEFIDAPSNTSSPKGKKSSDETEQHPNDSPSREQMVEQNPTNSKTSGTNEENSKNNDDWDDEEAPQMDD